MLKSDIFLFFIAILIFIFTILLFYSHFKSDIHITHLKQNIELTQKIGITDLCIFTEARYTRHPSIADRHSAFQDYPMSFDHFPSGSLLMPPETVKK